VSRKTWLRKSYGHKVSSGRLKTGGYWFWEGMAAPYCEELTERSPIFLPKNSQDVGVGNYARKAASTYQNLQLEESPGFFS